MGAKRRWVLYLDFDGVLNNDPFLRHQNNHVPRERHRLFDPNNLASADLLCRKLPVEEITVTSTWREGRTVGELRSLLRDEGFEHAELIGSTTPLLGDRSHEIREHALSAGVERFIVLDDMPLGALQPPIFFRTSSAVGLDTRLVREILTMVG